MSKIFDSIATRTLPESVFDLSHDHKLSFNMGELVPTFLEEVLPGDTFQVKSEILIRLAPMLAPVMHRVNVYTHYFYVPNRLVWDNFHDHITGGEDGLANPTHPYIDISEGNKQHFGRGSLADYLGVPPVGAETITENVRISSLPFRGYQTIFNEFYRDQDLTPKAHVFTGDGNDPDPLWPQTLTLRKRAWERDYFTSARPDTQKGPAVSIGLDASVQYKTIATATATGNPGPMTVIQNDQIAANGVSTGIDNIESISADITVESQRRANRLQEWMELAMRGGSRINEVIRNFFGVTPDDLRLTRPQYLGGGMQNVIMSEVLNTAGDTGTTLQPLGEYGGHGISVGNQNGFRERFKEHGYVFGITSVIPKTAYFHGIHRHWTKFDKYEKYWPQFANIGEQEILNQEIYAGYAGTTASRETTFGYAPRYSEYKYACSKISGDFIKDSDGDNLSYWHMARDFGGTPTLNGDFVESDPTHRIFAVTDETVDKLYCSIHHKVKAKRKMPYHNIPSNMPIY